MSVLLDVEEVDRGTVVEDTAHGLAQLGRSKTRVVIQIELQRVGGVTAAAARYIGALYGSFGNLPIGTVAVRFIRGTDVWSQHSYGNAVDVLVSGELHRRVAFWSQANRTSLAIAHLLADPYFPSPLGDHRTHVHVDFYPQWGGTPPGRPI